MCGGDKLLKISVLYCNTGIQNKKELQVPVQSEEYKMKCKRSKDMKWW